MPITIGRNIASLQAQRALSKATDELSRVYESLSSGLRINRASDDAVGLAISMSLNADSRKFAAAARNISDGMSALSIAEGAVQNLTSVVVRITELAEQSSNGVYSAAQRSALDKEGQALAAEYNRIIETTKFNGKSLLGNDATSIVLQVGITKEASSLLNVNLSASFEVTGDGTFSNGSEVGSGLGALKTALLTDVNNDSVLDYVVQGNSSSSIFLALGNSDGSFKVPRNLSPGAGTGTATGAGDTNNDGNIDLLFQNGGSFYQLLGNGDGTFLAKTAVVSGITWDDAVLTDLNGDGNTDIVGADDTSGGVDVVFGNGNGTFKAATGYGTADLVDLSLGDINNDGLVDIVGQHGTGFTVSMLGNGNGTFKAQQLYNDLSSGRFNALADFNRDGNLDVLSSGNNGLGILLGNGDGSFKALSTLYSAGSLQDVLARDFDNDSFIDIAYVTAGSLHIRIGNGNGTFKAPVSYTSSSADSNPMVAGDTNRDGVDDILMGGAGGTAQIFIAGTQSSSSLSNFSLTSQASALSTLTSMRTVLTNLASLQGDIGATQSRLASMLSLTHVSRDNYLAAESRIKDADIAQESADLVRRQILQSAASAVLAQANQQPALALKLLNG